MGSSCSSGQAHKDKDTGSTRSEESPSYQVSHKVDSAGINSGVVLQVSADPKRHQREEHNSQEVRPQPIPAPPHCLPSVSDTASPSSPAPLSADRPNRDGSVHGSRGVEVTEPEEVEDLESLVRAQTTKTPKIVVYICAADSQDCKVEKGVLHNEVYPQLRRRCRDKGFELHIVDLHWSLQEKTPEPAELCLHELRRQAERCYVVPVVLLNGTLGAAMLPKTIESVDFETAASGGVGRCAGGQASNSPLLKWYRRDSHAQPPCYRLLPAAYHIPAFKSENKEEKAKAGEVWRSEVEKILSVMLATFTEELRDTYLSTVIEQEVQHTVLMSRELARRCLWLSRVYTHAPQQSNNNNNGNTGPNNTGNEAGVASGPAEAELNRRLALLQRALKAELNESHIVRLQVKWSPGGLDPTSVTDHAHYLAQVAAAAEKHLATVIDAIVEEHNNKVSVQKVQRLAGWLVTEIADQWRWAESCAQCSVNRQSTLHNIKDWDGDGPIIVFGAEGCGKTTLASRLVQTLAKDISPTRIVFRTANLTRRSSSLAYILLSVILQCRFLEVASKEDSRPKRKQLGPHTVANYSKILPEVLEAASTPEQTLAVIIDGIDQLREFSDRTVDWVPTILPNNVKLVITLSEDGQAFSDLKEALKTSKALFLQMTDLDKTEGESILLSSVVEYNHSVNSHVQDCVLASVQKCTLPLYIKTLAWQTSWCSEFEHSLQPRGNLRDQLSNMLSDLETILGQKLVEMCLSLLTAAKWGLTDSEMVDLLTSNKDFHTSTTYLAWAGACLFWSVLSKQLWPFLRWHGGGGSSLTVTWRDWSLRKTVEDRYKLKTAWAHSTLLAYFTGKLCDDSSEIKARMIDQPNKFSKSYNRRKLEEVPYQCYKVTGTCKSYLEDHEWIFDKLCGSSVYQVLEDLRLEGSPDLDWLQQALEASAQALDYDGSQFYAQMALRLAQSDATTLPPPAKKLMDLIDNGPPVQSLIHVTHPEHNCRKDSGGDSTAEKCFDWLVRLPNDPGFVVTLRTDKEEISVWDVHKCEQVRTLRGVPQPLSLQMMDDFKCVVLCKRELRTYDLDRGVLLTKLKGVMNQKMPYYGLHDAGHLVALSRNRMYVNLMNLITGDLVTTFKAGEDRFLNSLLVSGDGRMLVCGDETQKPFPLLVWNLASRKLLYDLRIPGHDFITSLSAITHQGHYVCCVAKEVDEPSPNFIVVYDLQSGTLFKKWKPGVDCVAVDISSRDGCVVSGHADGSILVWDLVTGNCRCKLRGHTAPVSFLRLDPEASACLSRDALGRDPSLRLWDLSTGEPSAVFTPDDPISGCELTGRGRTVVFTSLGSRSISCLNLRGPTLEDTRSTTDVEVDVSSGDVPRCYGDAENAGRVFLLEER